MSFPSMAATVDVHELISFFDRKKERIFHVHMLVKSSRYCCSKSKFYDGASASAFFEVVINFPSSFRFMLL